jgi:hypothetical protein
MKENNNIDKLFKEKLGTGNFTYQPGYWTNAEKLITAQTAKAGGLFGLGIKTIWLIALPIAAGLTTLVWLAATSTNEQQAAPTYQEQRIVNTPVPENTQPNNPAPNDAVLTPIVTTEPSTPVSENEKIHLKDAEPSSVASAEVQAVAPANPSDIISEANEQNNRAITELNPFRAERTPHQSVAKASQASEQGAAAVAMTSKTERDEVEMSDQKMVAPAVSNETTPQEVAQVSREEMALSDQKENAPNALNQSPALTADKKVDDEEKAPIILPHQKNKTWLISAGVEYSYFFANRYLSGTAANTDYVDFRNKYEQARNITSIGANVLLERNNWLLSTGVYQSTINEDINYPNTLSVLTGVDNGTWNVQEIWSYSVDSNWAILGINQGGWNYDTSWTRTFDSTYVEQWDSVYTEKEDPEVAANNGRHSMSYIEIPLLAGRSFGGEKLRFEVQAGGAVGILTGTEGSIYINPGLDGLVAQNNHQEQFREWQFNLLLRAGIRYDITPQIQARLFPSLRYSLTNALKSDAVKQRYLGYGINLGVSYRF